MHTELPPNHLTRCVVAGFGIAWIASWLLMLPCPKPLVRAGGAPEVGT